MSRMVSTIEVGNSSACSRSDAYGTTSLSTNSLYRSDDLLLFFCQRANTHEPAVAAEASGANAATRSSWASIESIARLKRCR